MSGGGTDAAAAKDQCSADDDQGDGPKDTHGAVLDDLEAGQHEYAAEEEQDEAADVGAVDELHDADGDKDHGPIHEDLEHLEIDNPKVAQQKEDADKDEHHWPAEFSSFHK